MADATDSNQKGVVSGSCFCGSVRWISNEAPLRGGFCYCSTCRKLSGGAFIAFITFNISAIEYVPPLSSENSRFKALHSSESAERGYCSDCGSALMMKYKVDPGIIHMAMGSVDHAKDGMLEGLALKHIYLVDKPEWYSVPNDGYPRHDTMPNAEKYLSSKN